MRVQERFACWIRPFALCLLTSLPILSASAQTVTYDYDSVGRVRSATYADGTVVQYTYDAVGNRTSQDIVSSAGTPPPNIPQSISPAHGEAEIIPGQTFQAAVSWQAPSGGPAVDHYEVQRALNSPGFSQILGMTSHPGGVATASFTLLPANPPNRYYFRVRACNAAGECSGWRESALWEVRAFLECSGCEPPPDG